MSAKQKCKEAEGKRKDEVIKQWQVKKLQNVLLKQKQEKNAKILQVENQNAAMCLRGNFLFYSFNFFINQYFLNIASNIKATAIIYHLESLRYKPILTNIRAKE